MSGGASTDWTVILGGALCSQPASVGTRIDALLVRARLLRRTMGADRTFGTAI